MYKYSCESTGDGHDDSRGKESGTGSGSEARLGKGWELWQFAADNYPAHNGSALAIADIERLQLKATGCKEFAESLAEREDGYDIMDDFNWVGSRHHY